MSAQSSQNASGILPPSSATISGKSRTARACSSCNRQKLRCDGQQPCSRCALNSTAFTVCEYLPSLRGKTRKRKKSWQNEENQNDQVMLSRHDAGVARRLSDLDGNGPSVTRRVFWTPESRSDTSYPTQSVSALWKTDKSENNKKANEDFSDAARRKDRAHSLSTALPQDESSTTSSPTSTVLPPVEKLSSLPYPGDAHNPLAILVEASSSAQALPGLHSPEVEIRPASVVIGATPAGDHDPGDYYAPLERVLRDEAPIIMQYIDVHEAEQLFDVYFKYLHPHLPVLDKEHSSALAVARRANYLFNAICCVAARTFNVVLWDRLKVFARAEMERVPRDKNIDVVQAHLIYTMWNLIRPERFEQDMTWIRAGTAIRTGLDINLHRVALVTQARQGLPTWILRSIVRTWLLSFIVDYTLSAQLGKPNSIRAENGISQYMRLLLDLDQPSADDLWVAGLAEWTQILARALDVCRNYSTDLINQDQRPDLIDVFTKQFRDWQIRLDDAVGRLHSFDQSTRLLRANIRLYHGYARVILNSFSLQRAVDEIPVNLPSAFVQYQSSCVSLIETFEDQIESEGLARGCPDFVYTTLTYAAVSLLKATQPHFAHLNPDSRHILSTARRAANMLARAATSPDHLPASQSIFISHLIELKSSKAPGAIVSTQRPDATDYEAFGQAVLEDQSRTMWPPPSLDGTTSLSTSATDRNSDSIFGLSTRAAQTQAYQFLGTSLGLEMRNPQQDQDLLLTQDLFWRNLMEGVEPFQSHDQASR